jgi:hypothetical protein
VHAGAADSVRMTSFGPQISQSVAGSGQAERVAARNVDRKRTEPPRPTRARPVDQVELEVEGAESSDAVRGLKGNEQEESGADRQRKNPPASPSAKPAKDAEPRIDLNA